MGFGFIPQEEMGSKMIKYVKHLGSVNAHTHDYTEYEFEYIYITFSLALPNLLEEVTLLAGCGAGTLLWGQRTTCSNKAGGV